MKQDLEGLCAALETAEATRRVREGSWRELASYVHPVADRFAQGHARAMPQRVLYDSTALVAAEQLANALFALVSDPGLRWFRLEARGQAAGSAWIEDAEAGLRHALNEGGQAFLCQVNEALRDLVVFGTAGMLVEEAADGKGLRFANLGLEQLVLGAYGGHALGLRGRKLSVPAQVAQATWPLAYAQARSGEVSVAQVTLYEPSQVKPWRVVWLDLENRHVLQEQRQSTSPIQVVRWSHAGAHAWGEGLGSLVLADVKTLNLMVKLNLTAAQKAVDPPLLAHEELGVRAIKTQPGALIYGALDREGRRLLEPFTSGANVPLGLEMEEQKRRQIRSVFMTPLSLLNGEGAARTATEIMTGREERFQQFVPVLNRIQAELFTPVLERALELLVRQGAIDTPPGSVAFRFITPFSQARRNAEARRLLSTLETLRPLTEAVPQLAERLDLEQAFAEVAEGLGTPLRANPPETQETAEVSV